MSVKEHEVKCCGCRLYIEASGTARRGGSGDSGYFDNMRQVREAAKNHRRFCTNYTGRFHIKAEWFHDGTAEWHIEVSA